MFKSAVMVAAILVTGAHPIPTNHAIDVRDYGAVGDGVANDTPAVNRAIEAANATGRRTTVHFPAGTYLAGGSIHMLSNVTLSLDTGATLLGAPSGYDEPEPNPNDAYQDFGHSHFHDAMIWGDGLTNIGFVGGGVIDGGGNFITGNPRPGQADKLISLTRCDGLVVGGGLTLRRGGHFAMLINGCQNVYSDRLTIDTAGDRDGWNIISTRNVLITNINIAANDDALAFKSDWALGATLANGNVVVRNAQLSARCCNGLMFGSETCGDFANYWFSRISITGAGKSGLGMVSMDGAHISNVHYHDITLSGTASPITQKVGIRRRCGGTPGVGSISDIHYSKISGTNAGVFSPTLWGQPDHHISDVTFDDVHLTLPGGRPAQDPNVVPQDNGDYNPNSLSTRPAYGFYLHNVDRIAFTDSSLALAADDGRPAFIANAGRDITLRRVTVQRGPTSPFDLGFQDIYGYCVRSAGARLSTPGSTPSCHSGIPTFSLTATPPNGTVTAGGSLKYQIKSTGDAALSVTGLPPGAQATFAPNPVRAGSAQWAGYGSAKTAPPGAGRSATLTVTVPPSTRNGDYVLTVVGTGATATQYVRLGLTVTGGVDLNVTDLAVADPANAVDWSVRSNLQAGDQLFGDRTYTVASVPAALVGARWIRTANDSRLASADPLATFTLSAPATVVVGIDTRQSRPAWLDATWTDQDAQLNDYEGATTFRRFQLYAKQFPAGPVSLGPTGLTSASANMYTIAVL